MSEPSITRLVVGPPRAVVLGVPVGQRVNAKGSSEAWSAGSWLLHQGRRLAKPIGPRRRSFSITLRAPEARGRKFLLLATLSAVFVGVAAVGVFLNMRKSAPAAASPFGLAAKPTAVTVLDQPYVVPEEQGMPLGTSQEPTTGADTLGPVPFPVAVGPVKDPKVTQTNEAASRQRSPAAQAKPAPVPPPEPVKVVKPAPVPPLEPVKVAKPAPPPPESVKAGKPAYMVLDEEATSARVAKSAANTTPHVVAPSLSNPAKPNLQDRPGPVAATPSPIRGTGLVAITPDGKVAVFTNPATRMPEQFKVGEKLPSGDTVKAIDAQSGKVVTTSKEYGLE